MCIKKAANTIRSSEAFVRFCKIFFFIPFKTVTVERIGKKREFCVELIL